MRPIKLGLALFLFSILVACKIHYDKSIVCPSFEAKGVAVWKWDADTYFVLQCDGQHILINDTGCAVGEEH